MTIQLLPQLNFAKIRSLGLGMLSQLHIITATHHQFSLEELGMLTKPIDKDTFLDHISFIRSRHNLKECLYVNTCNRVMYVFVAENPAIEELAFDLFGKIDSEEIQRLEVLHAQEAVKHFYEVASSLQSMVVGEREILKQIKDAYAWQKELALPGDTIRLLVESTIEVAKKVYTNTKIGEKPISVVSLAVNKMKSLGLNSNSRIAIIGSGQTITLLSKYLIKHQVSRVQIFNRTIEKAKMIADKLDGSAHSIVNLASEIDEFDFLVSCTGSPDLIVDSRLFQQFIENEPTRSRVVVDLAIPRDIDPSIKSQNASLVQIEDLQELANENMTFRKKEVAKARIIIHKQIQHFAQLINQRSIERMLGQLPSAIRGMKERAIHEVFDKEIQALDPGAQSVLFKMMDYMEKKCIGIPMKLAKEAAG